jgi:anion-transporting  ArsA/GET3 family ATPase
MDVKKAAMGQLMKLMQNPKVMQVAMNPKVMGAVMTAMSMRGKVASAASSATQTVARSLNLATREEVRELRRTIRRLEEQLNRYEESEADTIGGEDQS